MEVDFTLPSEGVIRELKQIISWRGKPEVIRCDNGSPEFISSWGKHVDFIRFYFETCPYKRVTGLIWLGKLTFKALNTLASSGLMVPTPDMGSDPLMETR